MNNETVLKVENLSKVYRLGEVGTGTISHDLNRWWARVRGKEDPFTKVGSVNDRTQAAAAKGEYVKALSDINFEVKKGEVLGIIGKNGAGKSTLLKVISQITSPTTGSIKAKGRIASLLEVGTGMHPEMTGKENVYLNGTILGMTKREIDAKFDEIMDFAGCAKYADTPVKRYSSGMKVRLGFAVAAFLEPEILIVDEVLAVGDAEFQKKAIGKMQDISSGGGRTVLFVSHNMRSVEKLCKSSILLNSGMLFKFGSTDEIIGLYNQNKEFRYGNYSVSEKIKKNCEAYVYSFRLKDKSGDSKEVFSFEDSIHIEIGIYFNNCDIQNYNFSFSIISQNSTVVLNSNILDSEIHSYLKRGENVVIAKIPSHFLNHGNYHFRFFLLTVHSKEIVQAENAASFSVTEQGMEPSVIGGGKAILRPRLKYYLS